ncbi:MAG: hypothetical protein V4467_01715 [Patescibacteria group bacterium]
MKKLRLKKPVTITGLDCFGRKAWLTLSPTDEPGWHWKPYLGHNLLLPIDWRIAKYSKLFRFLYLHHEGLKLRIIEHVLPLRFTGLDGVIVTGSGWPPYHGRCWDLWDVVKPKTLEIDENVSWITPTRKYEWGYSVSGRSVTLCPIRFESMPNLQVRVEINYPGLGEKNAHLVFPGDLEVLEEIFRARAQGWPPKRRYAFCWLASLFGSPMINTVCWPQKYSKAQALQKFLFHRVQDILGGTALSHHSALMAGTIMSCRGGHEADLGLLSFCKFRSPVLVPEKIFV